MLVALLLAAQVSVSDSIWTEDADNYSITMTYPSIALENDVIGNRLEEYAMARVTTFKEHFLEYFNPEVQMDWGLETNFTLDPSPEGMICIISWTWEYAGRAHGNTWTQAFVYDSEAEAFIGPVELLGGETERSRSPGRLLGKAGCYREESSFSKEKCSELENSI